MSIALIVLTQTLCFGDPALSVRVLSLGNSDTFVPALVSGHCPEPQARPCLKLVFSDGRVIVCTPDHRILTPNGYVEAQALKKDDRVVVGPDAPLYDPAEDLPGHLYRFRLHLPASAVRSVRCPARVDPFADHAPYEDAWRRGACACIRA